MKEEYTHCALGEVNGQIGVFGKLAAKRAKLKNETNSKGHPFLGYINADNLQDFMLAIDDIYKVHEDTDFITDLSTGGTIPITPQRKSAKTICGWFDNTNPTRTELEKTRETLTAWSINEAHPKSGYSDDEALHRFFPLEDLIAAKNDLRQSALFMAWLLRKTDFEAVHGLPSNDRNAKLRLIGAEEPSYLHDYYEELKRNTGNVFISLGTNMAILQPHLYNPADIEEAIRSYVSSTFSLLMSDQRRIMSQKDLSMHFCNHSILSAIWGYFADGISKQSGKGSIGVCKHCHHFFEQQRKTRVFCSDSCRVMHKNALTK